MAEQTCRTIRIGISGTSGKDVGLESAVAALCPEQGDDDFVQIEIVQIEIGGSITAVRTLNGRVAANT